VREFSANGHRCRVLTRRASERRSMRLAKNAQLVETDVHDSDSLARAFEGADAVVSMAGILNQATLGGDDFERVHVQLPARIADACSGSGVRRLLHVSALNAGQGDSKYLQSKGEAEKLLRGREDLDLTIFQPSVIFGPGDSFFNRFATLLRLSPVLPLACADARMQPVYACDVASAMAASLEDQGTVGQTYELGGPEVRTLGELVRFTAKTLGLRRIVIPQPDAVSRVQGALMGLLPGAPFSLDNFRSLKSDNVTRDNGLGSFGITPSSIEAVVPSYLGCSVRQQRLRSIREQARRG